MRPDPTILAFDTSAAHCAAALLKGDAILGERVDPMAKGQAEHLMPMLLAVLKSQSVELAELDAIAVGIGPGNFTGIRISVSAARGLALALGIPAVGVSTFEVMRDPNELAANAAEIVSVEAPKQTAYIQHFRYGKPQGKPRQIDPAAAPEDIGMANMTVRGYRADEIAHPFNAGFENAVLEDIPRRLLRCAEYRLVTQQEPISRPIPLYARPADAAPPRNPAPVMLG
ncbi:MAG: tRNA (adenosine(37)-N6)-threonylcarbamoyltransferase complex dimerization subunit type 1 TsaB [Paracoccaceae bacterium]